MRSSERQTRKSFPRRTRTRIPILPFVECGRVARFPQVAAAGEYPRGPRRGRRRQGESVPDSDVDILVDVDPAIGLEFVALADELEELLGVHVELVSERAMKPRNLDRIRKDLIDVGAA